MSDRQTFTLPAGTICRRGGVPFMLMHATQIETHPGNWPLICDGLGRSEPLVPADTPPALSFEQLRAGLDAPPRLSVPAALSAGNRENHEALYRNQDHPGRASNEDCRDR